MLPGQVLSTTVLPSTFLPPRQVLRSASDANIAPQSIGGAGFRDTSQGLNSQVWIGSYSGSNVILTPAVGAPLVPIAGMTGIIWFDFTFDQSMNPVVAYAKADLTVQFLWFDTLISANRTTALPFGTDPWPFCQLDDSRSSEISTGDVVVTYTRAGHLYFLAQRDRYGVEYDLGAVVPVGKVMVGAGMNHINRFQFEFATILPDLHVAYGKFVGSKVFKAVQAGRVGDVRPRIWPTKKNNTVLA